MCSLKQIFNILRFKEEDYGLNARGLVGSQKNNYYLNFYRIVIGYIKCLVINLL